MANGIVLNIDTTKSEFQNPMVQLRQGDGNYQSLAVTVTSNGEPFDLTGWTITFMGTTAGGFKIVDSASVVTNASQGEFTYTPTKAWGQDEGEFKNAYFKFVKSEETASGASFRVNVLDAVDLTAEEAKDYISVVDVMIDQVKTDMETKLAETKQTLADTQSQSNTVQTNVNDLNTSVNDLKTQNLNIKTTDNTWAGTNTFTNQINGSLATKTITTPTDLFTLTSGSYYNPGSINTNAPADATTYYTIEVIQVISNGLMRLVDHKGNSFWVTKDGGSWREWHQDADDSTVVHKTGTETVAGDKTFTSTLWANYGLELQGTTPYIDFHFNNDAADYTSRIIEMSKGALSVNGIDISDGTVSGTLNGNASSSTKLQTPRKINGVGFDGTDDINVNAANDSNLVHLAGNETVAGDKTFTGNVSVTGSLDAKQKIYNRTINPVAGLSIIYKRVGNIVSGRFKADLSGDFQLNNNDGYKSPSEYPVNVIVGTGTDAWFTQDNKFHTNAISQGNFIFITDDPFPTN